MNRTTSKCLCGKRKSKYSNWCNACHEEKQDKIKADNQRILDKGVCPYCGGKLQRNLSLTGWYQCEQLGAETFRKDPTKPSCGFQLFV